MNPKYSIDLQGNIRLTGSVLFFVLARLVTKETISYSNKDKPLKHITLDGH